MVGPCFKAGPVSDPAIAGISMLIASRVSGLVFQMWTHSPASCLGI